MKCKDCHACKKGFWAIKPEAYICIGVKEPFEINDINNECTEHKWATLVQPSEVYIKQLPYVGDDGIYTPVNEYVQEGCAGTYRLVLSKEMFIEAYTKWILPSNFAFVVRCKDCEHYKRVKGAVEGWSDCALCHDDMDPDDFCSRGVLRKNS